MRCRGLHGILTSVTGTEDIYTILRTSTVHDRTIAFRASPAWREARKAANRGTVSYFALFGLSWWAKRRAGSVCVITNHSRMPNPCSRTQQRMGRYVAHVLRRRLHRNNPPARPMISVVAVGSGTAVISPLTVTLSWYQRSLAFASPPTILKYAVSVRFEMGVPPLSADIDS